MKYGWTSILGVALVITGLWAAAAERDESTATREDKNAESRKLLEEVLMVRLTRELALDEEQTILMVRHMAEYRDRMTAIRRERAEKMRELRQAVRESKDETRIGTLTDDVLALNEKSAAAHDDIFEFDAFELTPWQRARLLLFMNDFESDMRRLLRRAQERKESNANSSSEGSAERKKSGSRGEGPKNKALEDAPEATEEVPAAAPSS